MMWYSDQKTECNFSKCHVTPTLTFAVTSNFKDFLRISSATTRQKSLLPVTDVSAMQYGRSFS